jgi:hypothetical protein
MRDIILMPHFALSLSNFGVARTDSTILHS